MFTNYYFIDIFLVVGWVTQYSFWTSVSIDLNVSVCVCVVPSFMYHAAHLSQLRQRHLPTLTIDSRQQHLKSTYNQPVHSHAGTRHIIVSYTVHRDVTMHYLLSGHTEIKKASENTKMPTNVRISSHCSDRESEHNQHAVLEYSTWLG